MKQVSSPPFPLERIEEMTRLLNMGEDHIDQIKAALGISEVISSNSAWSKKSDGEEGTQIDLLIRRNDNVINMCEIKFLSEDFKVDKKLLQGSSQQTGTTQRVCISKQ